MAPGHGELFRATIFHTPANPFRVEGALRAYADGALFVQHGRVSACGDYAHVRVLAPDAPCADLRGGVLLPGLVDAHVHFPQVRITGHLGLSLFDWLHQVALPEEARLADVAYATVLARQFVRALAESGTTTALAFGAHFIGATAALFDAAAVAGLRVVSGLCLSDRFLRPDLLGAPEDAYRASTELIRTYHGRRRLAYAVTPRFALSTSEAMLEVCQSLVREHRTVRVHSHLNESQAEVEELRRAFPWALDSLSVYERYGLTGPRAVYAHNVWPAERELDQMAADRTTVAHCPCSNMALGSGIFPLGRHVAAGVHCALGTDVGAGIGFGMLKEALQAYLLQRVGPHGRALTPAELLYLATRAGAEALGLEHEVGDFAFGKAADFVYVRPQPGSVFESVIRRAEGLDAVLAAVIAHAREDSIHEVRVEGTIVHPPPHDT